MCERAHARIMRITCRVFIAAIDIAADSSATADAVQRLVGKGRVVLSKDDSVRSVVFADGSRGIVVCFSPLSPIAVRKQIKENGFIIV